MKHGIYSQALAEEDYEILEHIELGSLDHEIKIAKIRLRRAIAEQVRQEAAEHDPSRLEVSEIKISSSAGRSETEVRRVRRCYDKEIRSFIRLIADLEVKRKLIDGGALDNSPEDVAARIKAALDQIDAVNSPDGKDSPASKEDTSNG